VDKSVEDPLVAKAFDADQHEALAHAIQNLSSDEAQFFLDKLERAIRKRKIQITGYLVAMLVWALGMLFGLVWAGTAWNSLFTTVRLAAIAAPLRAPLEPRPIEGARGAGRATHMLAGTSGRALTAPAV
jgi:hypothetical protein